MRGDPRLYSDLTQNAELRLVLAGGLCPRKVKAWPVGFQQPTRVKDQGRTPSEVPEHGDAQCCGPKPGCT